AVFRSISDVGQFLGQATLIPPVDNANVQSKTIGYVQATCRERVTQTIPDRSAREVRVWLDEIKIKARPTGRGGDGYYPVWNDFLLCQSPERFGKDGWRDAGDGDEDNLAIASLLRDPSIVIFQSSASRRSMC